MGLGSLAIAPLVLVLAGAFCYRFPASAVVATFTLTGVYGSLIAFTGVSGANLVDVLLVGLWTSLLISRLIGEGSREQVLWPAMIVLGLYLMLTVLSVLTSESVYGAFLSFRLSGWFLLAVVLIAYAGWRRDVLVRIAKGVVVIGVILGGYACLRFFIGPAQAELDYALTVAGNFNLVEGTLRTFGSFNSGHQLGFWAGAVAPFCLGAALGWTGRWRKAAAAAAALCTFAVLASEVRGGFIGVVLGALAVIALYQLASSMPGFKLGRTVIVGATSVALISGALFFTAGANDRLDRYTNILSPEEDLAYVNRTVKWEEALDDIAEHPFGQGVGSGSINPVVQGPYLSIANYSIDNSFLKIAYEQGMAILILFVVSMLLILLKLAGGAISAMRRETAGFAMGAAGSLIATMAVFYTGMEYEDVISLGPWLLVGIGAAFLIQEQTELAMAQQPVNSFRARSTRAQKAGLGRGSGSPGASNA